MHVNGTYHASARLHRGMSKSTLVLSPGAIGEELVFLVLLTLKLLGKISVSWWIVTLPLWGPFALLFVIVAFLFLVALLMRLFTA